ncbi:hypothetical protein BDZ89DRAFT_1045397 [Hymenopellis radicata]|nr:hypothetical protein BDZ89DRAFT_1045397 [Hymenopellis radicata]
MSRIDTDWQNPEDDALWDEQVALLESLSLEPSPVVEPIPGCQPPWRPAPGDQHIREQGGSPLWVVFRGRLLGVFTRWPDAQRQVSRYSNNEHEEARDWVHAVGMWQDRCKDGNLGRHVCGRPPSASADVTATTPSRPPPHTRGPSTPLRPPSASTPRVPNASTRPSQPSTPPSTRGRVRPVSSLNRGPSLSQSAPRTAESPLRPTASTSAPPPSPHNPQSSGSTSYLPGSSSQPSGSSSQSSTLRYFAVYVQGTTIVEIFRNRNGAEAYIEDIENSGGSVRLRAATNLDELTRMSKKNKKKPGPPPWIFGTKLEYFSAMKGDYETAVAAKNTQPWARRVTVGYWIRYAGITLSGDLAECPTVPSADEVKAWEQQNSTDLNALSPEERKTRQDEQNKFVQKVIQWFRTQLTQVRKDEGKDLLTILKKSTIKTTGMRRQQLVETFTQVYWETSFVRGDPSQTLSNLHQLELDRIAQEAADAYAAAVKLAVDTGEEAPPPFSPLTGSEQQKISMRAMRKVTGEQLLKVSPEVKAHLRKLNEEEFKSRKGDTKDGDDEEQSDFSTCLTQGVTFLEGVASLIEKKYGAICTILLAGQVREESPVTVRVVHAGKTLKRVGKAPAPSEKDSTPSQPSTLTAKVSTPPPASASTAAPTSSSNETNHSAPVPILRKDANAQLKETLDLLVVEERNHCIDLLNQMSREDFNGEKAYAERALKLWPYRLATRISPQSVMFGRKVNPGVVVDCIRDDKDEAMGDGEKDKDGPPTKQDLPPARGSSLPLRGLTPPPEDPMLPPPEEPMLPPPEEPMLPPPEEAMPPPPQEPMPPPLDPIRVPSPESTPPPKYPTPPPPDPIAVPLPEATPPPDYHTLSPTPTRQPTPIPEQPLPTSLAKDAEP